jgi:hypothetical protein
MVWFGVYLLGVGASLVLAPATMLPLVGLPPAADGWVRVAGVLVLNLGYANVTLGRAEAIAWFRTSVWMRGSVAVFFTAFAALGLAPPMLVAFGAIDLAGAAWTRRALRDEATASRASGGP